MVWYGLIVRTQLKWERQILQGDSLLSKKEHICREVSELQLTCHVFGGKPHQLEQRKEP